MPPTAQASEEGRLQQKLAFYNDLAWLDESGDDDEEEDPGLRGSVDALSQHSEVRAPRERDFRQKQPAVAEDRTRHDSDAKDSRSLPRSISDVGPTIRREPAMISQVDATLKSSKTATAAQDTPMLRSTFSGVLPPASSMPVATGKRKRESTVKLMPKDQQVFDGLHFYFFPNNEKHPARFMRITKVIAFGATWHRDWNKFITHVILDKSMNYTMLLKFLEKDTLPRDVTVVSEAWPSECIAYRALLDVTRPQFKVTGAPSATAKPGPVHPPDSSVESNTSLKLKPAGKDVTTRRPETPPRRITTESKQTTSNVTTENAIEANTEALKNVASTDELEAAISQARDLQILPLDDEEEAGSRPSSSGGTSAQLAPGQPARKLQTLQEKFQCMQKHTGEISNNANAATIVILQRMADYYGQVGDEWRIRAYRKAIATLRNHPTKVRTREEALALPNIGDRLATKIEEIAFTNRLRRLDNALAEPQDQVLQTFMGVYSAGFVQASRWVRQGYTTLDEVLQKVDLTENQRIGIEHYEDFHERIPHDEVSQHGEIVRKALQKLDPAFQVTIGGSYRRGSKDSGDIDLIITRPETELDHIRAVVVDQLVPTLYSQGFLKASLAATSGDGSKWHGASCLHPGDKPWRRIDFLLVPWAQVGAALIYFTGNDIFNRSMRLLASTKGYRLNQRGLYKDVIKGKGREKLTEGTLVEGRDERKIFDILGVPWRPPEHRIP